jgi:hypothetical protein
MVNALAMVKRYPLAEEDVMKEIIRSVLLVLIGTVSVAQAGSVPGGEGSLLVTAFLGFGAVILVFQLVPALLLLGSMIKGVLSLNKAEPLADVGRKS